MQSSYVFPVDLGVIMGCEAGYKKRNSYSFLRVISPEKDLYLCFYTVNLLISCGIDQFTNVVSHTG